MSDLLRRLGRIDGDLLSLQPQDLRDLCAKIGQPAASGVPDPRCGPPRYDRLDGPLASPPPRTWRSSLTPQKT